MAGLLAGLQDLKPLPSRVCASAGGPPAPSCAVPGPLKHSSPGDPDILHGGCLS